jgi:hypothetical protein
MLIAIQKEEREFKKNREIEFAKKKDRQVKGHNDLTTTIEKTRMTQ